MQECLKRTTWDFTEETVRIEDWEFINLPTSEILKKGFKFPEYRIEIETKRIANKSELLNNWIKIDDDPETDPNYNILTSDFDMVKDQINA